MERGKLFPNLVVNVVSQLERIENNARIMVSGGWVTMLGWKMRERKLRGYYVSIIEDVKN